MKQKRTHLIAETMPDLIKLLLYRPYEKNSLRHKDEICFTIQSAAEISNMMSWSLKERIKKLLIEHERRGHFAFIAKEGMRRKR